MSAKRNNFSDLEDFSEDEDVSMSPLKIDGAMDADGINLKVVEKESPIKTNQFPVLRASHTTSFQAKFKMVMEMAAKRKSLERPTERRTFPQLGKSPQKHEEFLAEKFGIDYENPLTAMEVSSNAAKRIAGETNNSPVVQTENDSPLKTDQLIVQDKYISDAIIFDTDSEMVLEQDTKRKSPERSTLLHAAGSPQEHENSFATNFGIDYENPFAAVQDDSYSPEWVAEVENNQSDVLKENDRPKQTHQYPWLRNVSRASSFNAKLKTMEAEDSPMFPMLFGVSHTNSFQEKFKMVLEMAAKRKSLKRPTERPTFPHLACKSPQNHAEYLAEKFGIDYENPLTAMEIAANSAKRVAREKNNQPDATELRRKHSMPHVINQNRITCCVSDPISSEDLLGDFSHIEPKFKPKMKSPLLSLSKNPRIGRYSPLQSLPELLPGSSTQRSPRQFNRKSTGHRSFSLASNSNSFPQNKRNRNSL